MSKSIYVHLDGNALVVLLGRQKSALLDIGLIARDLLNARSVEQALHAPVMGERIFVLQPLTRLSKGKRHARITMLVKDTTSTKTIKKKYVQKDLCVQVVPISLFFAQPDFSMIDLE